MWIERLRRDCTNYTKTSETHHLCSLGMHGLRPAYEKEAEVHSSGDHYTTHSSIHV